jgi:hypothetical protein
LKIYCPTNIKLLCKHAACERTIVQHHMADS